jgi:hypothetical protein
MRWTTDDADDGNDRHGRGWKQILAGKNDNDISPPMHRRQQFRQGWKLGADRRIC